jgi:hypothetical protein
MKEKPHLTLVAEEDGPHVQAADPRYKMKTSSLPTGPCTEDLHKWFEEWTEEEENEILEQIMVDDDAVDGPLTKELMEHWNCSQTSLVMLACTKGQKYL